MKICVTSQGDSLDSQVDPRFGRCPNFIIADIDTLQFEVIKNPNIDAMGGAGIQSGQLMASRQVKAVVTGNIGPNAFETLQAAGIEVITGASGSVKETIERYKKGELKPTKSPNTNSKFGMPGGVETKEVISMSFGRGGGQGQGRGMGRGMGKGGGRGKMGGTRPGAGPSGYCLCPSCGEKVVHQAGVPCNTLNCPQCGVRMVRE
jgi:predicted Fe-Mo cluster-binding NifX family protein